MILFCRVINSPHRCCSFKRQQQLFGGQIIISQKMQLFEIEDSCKLFLCWIFRMTWIYSVAETNYVIEQTLFSSYSFLLVYWYICSYFNMTSSIILQIYGVIEFLKPLVAVSKVSSSCEIFCHFCWWLLSRSPIFWLFRLIYQPDFEISMSMEN